MSNEYIPTAAQLSAVRAQMWHQAVPETPDVPHESAAEETAPAAEAADDDAASEDVTPEVQDAVEEGAEGERAIEDNSTAAEQIPAEQMSTEQIAAEAATPQATSALLTMEAVREFLDTCGLLEFQPLAQMAGAPAPTLVEATLGRRSESPTVGDAETARTILARLVADGSAVPLNLLGAATTTADAPDYVASTAAFAYVFTLRGDKTWKQLPGTSGANKVSPLAVNTYALLVEHGPQSAYALTGELGKGLTESAVLRALSELWQQLRVIPVVQTGGKPTIWEPVTTRLTKQIKAGANAGQPTALSALISLYLRQAILATEEEVATFLSPLAARSRVREVLHALLASQQLEEMVIEGRHHLHIAGELPEFAAPAEVARPADRPERGARAELSGEGRIKRFEGGGRPGATDRGARTRPFAAKKSGAAGPGRFGDKRGGRGERPAFARPRREQGEERPAERRFDRPWKEDARPRTTREDGGAGKPREARGGFRGEGGDAAPRKPWNPEGRPAFGRKPGFGQGRSGFGAGKPGGSGFAARGGDRPAFGRSRDRAEDGGTGEGRRPFEQRPERRERGSWGAPRDGAGRPAGGGGGRPPFGAGRRFEADGDRRPADRKPFGQKSSGDFSARPPRPRRDDGGEGGERSGSGGFRPRREGAPEGGGRPPFRRFDERPASRPFAGKRTARPEGGTGRPNREGSGPGGQREGADRPARKSFGSGRPDRGGADRPARPTPQGEGGKRGGPFDKFMGPARGGVKPWGKRPPARKTRPAGEDEA